MGFCSLCRVPCTEEHKFSCWHQHNEKLQAQGKMPMSLELFTQFEQQRYKKAKKKKKKKEKLNTSTSTATATSSIPPPQAVNKKNVNSWHWEERNCMPFVKKRIPELLLATDIPTNGYGTLRIVKVEEISGDAYINMRKGKFRLGFSITLGKVHWEGEHKTEDGTIVGSCKGTFAVNEFAEDARDADDYDIHKFKMDDPEENKDEEESEKLLAGMKKRDREEARRKLYSLMKKAGRPAIIKQLLRFTQEMYDQKDQMKA